MSHPDTILFLAANPLDTDPLRLDEESRAIDDALRGARKRAAFHVKPCWAANVKTLRRALLDSKPRFVHFSGHGEPRGILLEGPGGRSLPASGEGLAALFEAAGRTVECVILNACYSARQARAINQAVRHVIAMKRAVDDDDAITFAEAFYDGLGAGQDVPAAFATARASVLIHSKKAARILSLLTNPAIPAPSRPSAPRPRARGGTTRSRSGPVATGQVMGRVPTGPVMVINQSGGGAIATGAGAIAGGAGSIVLGQGGIITLGHSLRRAAGGLSARERGRLLRAGLKRIRSTGHE